MLSLPRPARLAKSLGRASVCRPWLMLGVALGLNNEGCTLTATVGKNLDEAADDDDDDDTNAASSDDESAGESGGESQGDDLTDATMSTTDTTETTATTSTWSNTDTSWSSESTWEQTQTQTSFCNPPPPGECHNEGGANALGIGCVTTEHTSQSQYTLSGPTLCTVTVRNRKLGGYSAQMGDDFLVLSTGRADNVFSSPLELFLANLCIPPAVDHEFSDILACPSEALDHEDFDADPESPTFRAVDPSGSSDCVDAPWLVGTGDCSNSMRRLLQGKVCPPIPGFEAGDCPDNLIKDLVELTIQVEVPPDVSSLSFDFAFLSAEYPYNYRRSPARFVDAFYAWVHSEKWTGNVAYDAKNLPISIDSAFLVHTSDEKSDSDPLKGIAYEGHGATPWLTTTFEVVPGEQLSLRFGIMDLGYNVLDSAVLLDNMRWGCESGHPTTVIR